MPTDTQTTRPAAAQTSTPPPDAVFISAGGSRYHATDDCPKLLSAQELSDWDYDYEFPPPPGARLPVMRAVRAVDPAQATADGKRPCLACFPAGAMPYLPMPATETFGHEPVTWAGHTGCIRCRTTSTDEYGKFPFPAAWPCTSAVVLGLAKRHDPPVEEREITPDNVAELYGWCEPSKLRHAVGSSGRLEVVGLTVWVGGVRTPALFGDTIIRDGSEFTVRPAAEVTR